MKIFYYDKKNEVDKYLKKNKRVENICKYSLIGVGVIGGILAVALYFNLL